MPSSNSRGRGNLNPSSFRRIEADATEYLASWQGPMHLLPATPNPPTYHATITPAAGVNGRQIEFCGTRTAGRARQPPSPSGGFGRPVPFRLRPARVVRGPSRSHAPQRLLARATGLVAIKRPYIRTPNGSLHDPDDVRSLAGFSDFVPILFSSKERKLLHYPFTAREMVPDSARQMSSPRSRCERVAPHKRRNQRRPRQRIR